MSSHDLESLSGSPLALLNILLEPPLVDIPPRPQCEVCVVVPVRNEAEQIEATLTALSAQIDGQGKPFDPNRYEVILLANNCTDDSAAIAHRFARKHPHFVLHVVEKTLPPSQAYIGRVRQLLMDEGYRRLTALGRKNGAIASTDGDSCVAPTWLAATLEEIGKGADAVGGRIVTNRADRANLDPYTRACYLRAVGYNFLISELEAYLDPDPFDPFPRHYQHMGASLAVTAQMYGKAGGMPAVRTPEDIAFYRALMRVGARFRHSLNVRVTTSARQMGRTEVGMANQLQRWAEMGQHHQAFYVESASALETRFRAKYALRALHQRVLKKEVFPIQYIASLARMLAIPPDWLIDKILQTQSFAWLFEEIEKCQQEQNVWQQRWPLVRIEDAIASLRLRLAEFRANQPSSIPLYSTLSPKSVRGDRALSKIGYS
ncbi:MAG: glycosyltransferase [Cyanobacteriota bacterium]|nr:glycosyltransferase [Cyanobacteriota bacterium]